MTDDRAVELSPQMRVSWLTAFALAVMGQVAQGIMRLGALALLGRFAGKTLLGEVSVLLAVSTFLVLLWPQPSGAAASRYISAYARDEPRQLAIAGFTSASVLLSVPFLAIPSAAISALWLEATFAEVIWSALLPICLGMAVYARGARNGRLRFKQGFVAECAGALTTLAVLIWILWAREFDHILLAFCAGYAVSALPGWPRANLGGLPERQRREIARYTAWTTTQVVFAGGLLHVTIALSALHATPRELGDLGAAVSIATPILLLSIALRTSTLPFVSRQAGGGDPRGARTATDSLLRIMVVVFIPLLGITCIWSGELLQLLYGQEFSTGSTLLVILLLGVGLNCFNAAQVWLMTAAPWGARALAICNGAGLVTGVTVAWVGSNLNSAIGSSVGYLVGSLISLSSATLVVWKSGRMPWAFLAARLVLGYFLIATSLAWTHEADWTHKLAVTILFVLVHAALSRTDVLRLRQSSHYLRSA